MADGRARSSVSPRLVGKVGEATGPAGGLVVVAHPASPGVGAPPDLEERKLLAGGDADTVVDALRGLRSPSGLRAWYLLEGPTVPDALLETPDALIVVEGKRTEAGPSTATKWLPGRHQMWRHIDAAWELKGRRRVYGFFIVETYNGAIPAH
jgi:hypothetical protein